jgi:hypothetical protein
LEGIFSFNVRTPHIHALVRQNRNSRWPCHGRVDGHRALSLELISMATFWKREKHRILAACIIAAFVMLLVAIIA